MIPSALERRPTIDYTHYRDNLARTGDLFGFIGTSFASRAILAVAPPVSHVGMVMVMPTFEAPKPVALIWESTTMNTTADYFYRNPLRGVQTLSLTDKVMGYETDETSHGRRAHLVRRLRAPLPPKDLRSLWGWRTEWRGDYETRPSGLLQVFLPTWMNSRENIRKMFCSELTARALKGLGMLRPERPSDSYLPSELVMEGEVVGLERWYHPAELVLV